LQNKGIRGQARSIAIVSYGTVVFNAVAGFLYTPWIIRSIGKQQYGLYTLAISFVSMFLLDFGLGSAVSRYLSRYLVEGNNEQANRFVGLVSRLYIIISGSISVVLLVCFLLIEVLFTSLLPTEIPVFRNLFLIVSFYSVVAFPFTTLNGIMISTGKYLALKSCMLAQRVLLVVLIVLSLFLNLGVYALVMANAISTLFGVLLKLFVVRKETTVQPDFRYKNRAQVKELFGFSMWMTVVQISQRFIFAITPSILAVTSGSEAIAYFGVAATIEGYVYSFAEALDGLFIPTITNYQLGNDSSKQTTDLMIKFGRIQLYVIALILIGFISIGRDFINLWIGEGFQDVYFMAVLLVAPSFLYLPVSVGRTAIVVAGKVKQQAIAYIFMALINVILCFILSVPLGALGASIGVFIAYLIRTLLMLWIMKHHLNLDLRLFYRKTYHVLCPLFLLALILAIVVTRFRVFSGWLGIIINICLITTIFGFLVIFFGFDDFERIFFKDILKRRGR